MILKDNWHGMRPLCVVGRMRWVTVGAMVLAMAATMVSQTAQRAERITQLVNPAEVVKIAGSVPAAARRATDLGEVNSGMQLESMSLNIGLSAAQQTEVDALLAAQQDPKSAQYHQWLTQEEYGARFGLTDADLSRVTQWLESVGFTVKSVAPSRNLITFSGTVAKAELAFGTKIHQYAEADGATHIGNTAEISIPKALSGVVVGVRGLSGFRPKPHAFKSVKPDYTWSSGYHNLAPGDWATIYNVNAIYSAGYTGTSMHVGVAGQTYIPKADITAFRTAAGLSAPLLNMVCISASNLCGAAASPGNEGVGDVGESDLDVEWAGGIARDATVDFIYAAENDKTQGVFDSLVYGITTYTVSSAVVPVIAVSYGDCESDISSSSNNLAYKTYLDGYLAQAATQGQTILISSGDDGAGCAMNSPYNVADQGLSVSWPASSPLVTAVGGTTFTGDGTGAGTYWSSSNTSGLDGIGSALQYIPETSWNDTAADQSGSGNSTNPLSSSGGGVSILYSGRMVPDISFTASADHDGYLVCTQNFTQSSGTPTSNPGTTCVNGFALSNGSYPVYGGTSASVQAFSGMLTLLVQAHGKQGNINPTLYSMAATPTTYPGVFNDITTGNNRQPCTAGSNGCMSGLTTGYSAGSGYDMVTGLGSINGGALYTALAGFAAGAPNSTTTLSVSPTSPAVGQSVTLQATVASGSSTVTTTPTGTVMFIVDGVQGSSLTLSSGTVSTTTSFSTSGTHSVMASYSGDGTFRPSSAYGTVTIPTTSTSYTVTPSSTTVSLSVGGSQQVGLTLQSNGFAGTVTFANISVTTSNGTAGAVTASMANSPVTLSGSGSTGSATLTITAGATAANHAPALPWKSSGAMVLAAMIGIPFTLRRRRALAVALTMLAISAAGFMMACGGGSSSSTTTKAARTYVVTVTPTGTPTGGTAVVGTPIAITVTVQ